MELILAIGLLISGYFNITNGCEKKQLTVLEIGVCSTAGECKVLLDNGKYKNMYLPMVGQKIDNYECK